MGIKNELKSVADRLDLLEDANNSITMHMNECVEEAMNFKIDEKVEKTLKNVEKGVDLIAKSIPNLKKMDLNGDGKVSAKEFLYWGGEMLNTQGFKMLLLTLFSITFSFLTDYLMTLLQMDDGGPLNMIVKLIAFAILTYGYKGVIFKLDKTKEDLVAIIKQKEDRIRELQDMVQADKLAISMLEYDAKK